MSDTTKLELMILDLQKAMMSGFEQVDQRFEKMDTRLGGLESRMQGLEDTLIYMREEMRDDSAATRALLGQAFEHISDQMASQDHAIQPSMIFRHSRSRTRSAV